MEYEDNNIKNKSNIGAYIKITFSILIMLLAFSLYAYTHPAQPQVYVKRTTYYSHFSPRDYHKYSAPRKARANVSDYRHGKILRDEKERNLQQYKCTRVQNFVKYYVNLFSTSVTHDNDDVSARKTLLAMAKRSVNSCACYYSAQQNDSMLQSVCAVRQCVIEYLLTFNAFTLARYMQTTQNKKLRTCLLHALYEHKVSAYIPLTVDLAMLHLVRAAHIDTRGTQNNLEEVAYDYISSALAQIAYSPCIEQVVHLRSAQQKSTFVNKMELSNYTMNLIIENILFGNMRAYKVREYMGHIAIVNLLSYTNYITTLLVSSLKDNNKINAKQYIDGIKRMGNKIHIVNVFNMFNNLSQRAQNAQAAIEHENLLKQLHEHCVGRALLTQKHTEIIVTLLQSMQQLHFVDKNTITQLIMHRVNVPLSIDARNILCRIWQLESDLYNEYISHYKLNMLTIHNDKLYTYTRGALYTQFSDIGKQEQQKLEALQLYNIPQNLQSILEALDVDNRTEMYSTKVQNKDTFAKSFSAAFTHLMSSWAMAQ